MGERWWTPGGSEEDHMPQPTKDDAGMPTPRPSSRALVLRGKMARFRAKVRGTNHVRELIETLVLMAIIFLLVHASAQVYRVDGPSMQPGLNNANYVLVSPILYAFGGSPQRGDVIVFYSPLDPTQQLIKRVIGVPGDTVSISPDGITVDSKRLNEPYARVAGTNAPLECSQNIPDIKVGPDQYLVLGDNRGDSLDSRCFGSVPRRNIIGKAVALVMPLGQLHWLNTYPSVFAGLH
jgi:signal peptidase I